KEVGVRGPGLSISHNPSSGTDFVRATFSHKGRREEEGNSVLVYIIRRIVYVIPIVISVALVCFLLVHITPGDPLVAILPADASQELAAQLRIAYGFDR